MATPELRGVVLQYLIDLVEQLIELGLVHTIGTRMTVFKPESGPIYPPSAPRLPQEGDFSSDGSCDGIGPAIVERPG